MYKIRLHERPKDKINIQFNSYDGSKEYEYTSYNLAEGEDKTVLIIEHKKKALKVNELECGNWYRYSDYSKVLYIKDNKNSMKTDVFEYTSDSNDESTYPKIYVGPKIISFSSLKDCGYYPFNDTITIYPENT